MRPEAAASPEAGQPPAIVWSPDVERCIFDDRVLVGHRERRLRAFAGEGYHLEIERAGRFVLDRTLSHLRVLPDPGVPAEDLAAVLLGPPLLLPLAARSVWALHGSAVATQGGAVVLLGDSGAGKSTLARELAREMGWRRLTDDLAPVSQTRLRPRYPQLKALSLAAESLEDSRPLAALVSVHPKPAGEPTRASPLAPRRTVELLARQTMIARLFDRQLTARHLAFASSLAAAVPAFALDYPHRPEAVAEAAESLARALGAQARLR